MGFVRSFEESSQDTYGDLLSQKRPRSRIKVGLLLLGYFEYWRMYPHTMKERVEGNLKAVEDRLTREYDIVCTGLVDTLDNADLSGRILRDGEIDALVVVLGTYVPDFISMHAINYVKNVPVVIFSAQERDTVNQAAQYAESMRNSSAMGVAQLTATFRKIGRKCRVVVGSVHDERAYGRIRSYLNAIQAIESIREANIGVIGNVFRGMYDLELSKTFLKGTFDVNVIYMQSTHLFDAWEQVPEEEAQALADRLMSRFAIRTVTRVDVIRACHLAVAMRKLVERFRLDALCFLDQHFIQKLFRTTARIGASLLLEDLSVPVCCEGDIGGLVMTMLMQSLSGRNPMQGEWGEYDEQYNAFVLKGHGVADPSLAVSDACVTLTRTPEDWGMDGVGLNYEFIVKPGVYTLGHFLEVPSGYTMLVSKVQSLAFPTLSYDEIHALIQVVPPVREYMERIFEYGVAHHCILGQGDMGNELEAIAGLLGLEHMTI